ncbi:MAG: NUDIX domain-containing protein [Candidatus Roizmanbacteria bacterium]
MYNHIPKWTVIFLLDNIVPTKIILLKRAPTKKFAPNYYTGIGGKVEDGETVIQGAYRELKEETGLNKIHLTEFAHAIVNNQRFLGYFVGVYQKDDVPICNEGILEWVSVDKLFEKQIIPTTGEVVKMWKKRQFQTDKQFSVLMHGIPIEGVTKDIIIDKVIEFIT